MLKGEAYTVSSEKNVVMETLRAKKKYAWEFDLSSVEQLKKLARSLSIKIETSDDVLALAGQTDMAFSTTSTAGIADDCTALK